jgi:hypothetical protein
MNGFPPSIELRSGELATELLPEWGGKMISLRTERDGYEFLAPAPLGPHVPEATAFTPADAYGFDEMFPGVYPQLYPAGPWQHVPIADHGDLWYRAWQYSGGGSQATLWTEDDRLGWRFGKTLRFADPSTLQTEYWAENRSYYPLHWLYCAHILLPFREGMELELPPAVYRCFETLGQPLPEVCREDADCLRRFEAFPDRSAAYYVSDKVGPTTCALVDRRAGKVLRLRWGEPLAYLGVWLNRSAWTAETPLVHLGLEPTTAGDQDLARWLRAANPRPLQPGESVRWCMWMTVEDCSG